MKETIIISLWMIFQQCLKYWKILAIFLPVIFRKYHRYVGIYRYFYRFFGKFPHVSLPVQPRPRPRIQNLSNSFFKKQIRRYLVIWSWFAGKGCVLHPSPKIVDLGFVKFKSSGIKAKRPLEQIQKTQGAKKKAIFLVFLRGFTCIFSEIKRGWIFPEIKMGDGFSWESNGGWKKKNNMIRLVPARIESGRGK